MNPAPPRARTLRRLFLTLFLRGRSSRGFKLQDRAEIRRPKAGARAVYLRAVRTACAIAFMHQPVFALAIYLHAYDVRVPRHVRFVFRRRSAVQQGGGGHPPAPARSAPKDLLWAKIRVLVEMSLWLAGALNLVGLVRRGYRCRTAAFCSRSFTSSPRCSKPCSAPAVSCWPISFVCAGSAASGWTV